MIVVYKNVQKEEFTYMQRTGDRSTHPHYETFIQNVDVEFVDVRNNPNREKYVVSQDFNFHNNNLFKGVLKKKGTCNKSI